MLERKYLLWQWHRFHFYKHQTLKKQMGGKEEIRTMHQ